MTFTAVRRQFAMATGIMQGLHRVTGLKSNLLTDRPFFGYYLLGLVSRALQLWRVDNTLELALEVAEAWQGPINYLNLVWPCPGKRILCLQKTSKTGPFILFYSSSETPHRKSTYVDYTSLHSLWSPASRASANNITIFDGCTHLNLQSNDFCHIIPLTYLLYSLRHLLCPSHYFFEISNTRTIRPTYTHIPCTIV
jgi:hypothetical protein